MPRDYFAYIRVSTVKQGTQGVSLPEQRDAIEHFADRHGLRISRWFEERETAAKRGRPVFMAMLRLLETGKAAGVIVHKIDRSARNLGDWARLGELIDQGTEVRFAVEDLDLRSRGGRLAADIQAVVAADYIRNLREETRKGFYGRLKAGIYPLPAPLGYLDMGAGRPKEVDPERGPLVRLAFDLYATGQWSLHALLDHLEGRGFRNRGGSALSLNGISKILHNPFYTGVIRLRRTGETFAGAHEPLVNPDTFERVQRVLAGKLAPRATRHSFMFRKLLRCKTCGYNLIGETHKGYVYYRCQSGGCKGTCVRQEVIEEAIQVAFRGVHLSPEELSDVQHNVQEVLGQRSREQTASMSSAALRVAQVEERLQRLLDAYLDGAVERVLYDQRKEALLMERAHLKDEEANGGRKAARLQERAEKYLELLQSVQALHSWADDRERRELIAIVTSNRVVDRKNVEVTLSAPFQDMAKARQSANGAPNRGAHRTLGKNLAQILVDWLAQQPVESAQSP